MKNLLKKIALYSLTALTLLTSLVTTAHADAMPHEPVAAASIPVMTVSEPRTWVGASAAKKINYVARGYAFLKDSHYKNGVAWASRKKPRLSKWTAYGCMAYALDFCQYVYGADWATSKKFKKITSVDQLTTGDAVRIDGHYFVILLRKGNKLYTAEGNYSSKVRASLTVHGYYIQNGRLYQNRYNAKGKTVGKKECKLITAYRFK